MKFLEWLLLKAPGDTVMGSELIEIAHHKGEDSSILWVNDGADVPFPAGEVADFYREYDGGVLFTSTFQIVSLKDDRFINGIPVVGTLAELQAEFDSYGVELPERCTAFMFQAGVGIYSASLESSRIFLYDTEREEVREIASLRAALETWIDTVWGAAPEA